jgi:hypothetical protein
MWSRKAARSPIDSFVKPPCLRALQLPRGAPEPLAPPCMRQRFFPATAGALQLPPLRVLARHRGLLSIGRQLRACEPVIYLPKRSVGLYILLWRSPGMWSRFDVPNNRLTASLDVDLTDHDLFGFSTASPIVYRFDKFSSYGCSL